MKLNLSIICLVSSSILFAGSPPDDDHREYFSDGRSDCHIGYDLDYRLAFGWPIEPFLEWSPEMSEYLYRDTYERFREPYDMV
jgi:hypothetical protein